MKSRAALWLFALTAVVPVAALSQSGTEPSTESQTSSQTADSGASASSVNDDAGAPTTTSEDAGALTTNSSDASTSSLATTSSTSAATTSSTSAATTSSTSAATATTRTMTPATSTPSVAGQTAVQPTPVAPTTTTASPPKKEDDGRSIDFLFLQPEFGASYTHVGAIQRMGRLQPELVEFQGWGWGGGVSAGFRIWLFAIAAHAYVHRFDGTGINLPNLSQPMSPMPAPAHFDLGQLMLDAHLRIPLPIVEPYIRVGFGYAWMGSFQINDRYRDSVAAVHGWTAKLGAGADFWIGKWFSLGAGFDLSIVNLRRGGVISPTMTCPTTDPTCVDLTMEGNAIGLTAATHIQATLHL